MNKNKINLPIMIILAILVFSTTIYFHFFATNNMAKEYLQEHGYQNVVVSAGSFWGCSKDEFGTTFNAIDKLGTPVSGQVCNSIFLKPAIRLD